MPSAPNLALRKLFLQSILFLVVVPCVLSDTDMQIATAIFQELKENTPAKAEAVFTLSNPVAVELNKDALTAEFDVRCGGVRDYKILLVDTCSREVPIFEDYVLCEEDTNSTNQVCYETEQIVGYTTEVYECYKEVDKVPVGTKDYKIVAKLSIGKCGDSWGYSVDWIPSLTAGGKEYKRADWAWWNATFPYRKRINITTSGRVKEPVWYPIHNDSQISSSAGYPYGLRLTDADGNIVPHDFFNTSYGLNIRWIANTGVYYLYYGYDAGMPDYSNCAIWTPCWESSSHKYLFIYSDTFTRANSQTIGNSETGGILFRERSWDSTCNVSYGQIQNNRLYVNDTSTSKHYSAYFSLASSYTTSPFYIGARYLVSNAANGLVAQIYYRINSTTLSDQLQHTGFVISGSSNWAMYNTSSGSFSPIFPVSAYTWFGVVHKFNLGTYKIQVSKDGGSWLPATPMNFRYNHNTFRNFYYQGINANTGWHYADDIHISRNEFYLYSTPAVLSVGGQESSLPIYSVAYDENVQHWDTTRYFLYILKEDITGLYVKLLIDGSVWYPTFTANDTHFIYSYERIVPLWVSNTQFRWVINYSRGGAYGVHYTPYYNQTILPLVIVPSYSLAPSVIYNTMPHNLTIYLPKIHTATLSGLSLSWNGIVKGNPNSSTANATHHILTYNLPVVHPFEGVVPFQFGYVYNYNSEQFFGVYNNDYVINSGCFPSFNLIRLGNCSINNTRLNIYNRTFYNCLWQLENRLESCNYTAPKWHYTPTYRHSDLYKITGDIIGRGLIGLKEGLPILIVGVVVVGIFITLRYRLTKTDI